jgi:UDP-N-acetylglucosamine 4-epimerase
MTAYEPLQQQRKLDEVQTLVSIKQQDNFQFINRDIRNSDDCRRACEGADYDLL